MFRRFITILASPGCHPALIVSAPSVLPAGSVEAEKAIPCDHSSLDLLKSEEKIASSQDDLATSTADSSVKVVDGIVAPRSRLDRYLDTVVHWSGSLPFFLFISSGLVAWAVLGVAGYDHDTNWIVLISDIQGVSTYILDSFLVRQQLAAHDSVLVVMAVLRLRGQSIEAMLCQLASQNIVVVKGHLVTLALFWISIAVWLVVAWAAAGPAFKFDATWWLLIGTYAGLVGMNDGFGMRHISAQFQAREGAELARLAETDSSRQALVPPTAYPRLAVLSLPAQAQHAIPPPRHLLLGAVVIAGLVVAASALKWSLTGQLLCNVPPSIIESFMMLMVIQGHNENDAKTRGDLNVVFERRAVLLAWARHVERYGVGTSVGFHPVLVGKYEPVVDVREEADKLDV